MENKKEDQHKGKFVGAYLGDEQFDKLRRIEEHLAEIFGKEDVSRSKALRFIIDRFDEKQLPTAPKGQAPAIAMYN